MRSLWFLLWVFIALPAFPDPGPLFKELENPKWKLRLLALAKISEIKTGIDEFSEEQVELLVKMLNDPEKNVRSKTMETFSHLFQPKGARISLPRWFRNSRKVQNLLRKKLIDSSEKVRKNAVGFWKRVGHHNTFTDGDFPNEAIDVLASDSCGKPCREILFREVAKISWEGVPFDEYVRACKAVVGPLNAPPRYNPEQIKQILHLKVGYVNEVPTPRERSQNPQDALVLFVQYMESDHPVLRQIGLRALPRLYPANTALPLSAYNAVREFVTPKDPLRDEALRVLRRRPTPIADSLCDPALKMLKAI